MVTYRLGRNSEKLFSTPRLFNAGGEGSGDGGSTIVGTIDRTSGGLSDLVGGVGKTDGRSSIRIDLVFSAWDLHSP